MSGTPHPEVVELWRYPVKSMLGEPLERATVTRLGFLGDRSLALVDVETGKVVSAKNPKRWPSMFAFRAAYVEEPSDGTLPPVRITMPGGEDVLSDDPRVDDTLSDALGRPVTLASRPPADAVYEYQTSTREDSPIIDVALSLAGPPGTFFDLLPIHVLTTSTLERLAELYPEGRFEVARFRPNIVVRTPGAGFVENEWSGRAISVGDRVRLDVFGALPRCVMTTLPQGDLPKDAGILRTIAKHNRVDVPLFGPGACAGVVASVASEGIVRAGDRVVLDS